MLRIWKSQWIDIDVDDPVFIFERWIDEEKRVFALRAKIIAIRKDMRREERGLLSRRWRMMLRKWYSQFTS